ncbi:FMN-binding negative transcriptional regulator [Halovulum sp. GXIMD14793]
MRHCSSALGETSAARSTFRMMASPAYKDQPYLTDTHLAQRRGFCQTERQPNARGTAMHPNPIFRKAKNKRNLDFARKRGFGLLTINGADTPLIAYAPFVLGEDCADIHLVASNPLWRALDTPKQAVLAVQGADGYISPDWYGIEDQVPTWNYVAVHLSGTLRRLDQSELRGQLDRLSAEFEARLAPKPEWKADKMMPEILARMMRMIRPVRLEISNIDGTWKLGQNKEEAVRISAAEALADSGIGQESAALAALMRDLPKD